MPPPPPSSRSSYSSSHSIVDTVTSVLKELFCVPVTNYRDIRVHHVVVLYSTWQFFTTTSVYRRLANASTTLLSKISEKCIQLVYWNILPDFIIRYGIRLQLKARLLDLQSATAEDELERKLAIVKALKTMPIAIETEAANSQHYEVPSRFYDLCLGPAKKYSSGYWKSGTTFAESETLMLDLYCERAQVQDGMHVVDLGCGWGSLTLHLAAKYPNCVITGISNSHSQREYILKTANERGLNVQNINIITCNVADDQGALDKVKDQDLVMTIEMFEHMKNYQNLLQKIHGFLKPNGRLFVHIFAHKNYAYNFEKGNWLADHFFTGGTMGSDDMLLYFAAAAAKSDSSSKDEINDKDASTSTPARFGIVNHWRVSGQHYEKTSNGWLLMLDMNYRKGLVKPVLTDIYGAGNENEWYINWRLFFMSCAELWGYDQGNEWIVSHYLFERQ